MVWEGDLGTKDKILLPLAGGPAEALFFSMVRQRVASSLPSYGACAWVKSIGLWHVSIAFDCVTMRNHSTSLSLSFLVWKMEINLFIYSLQWHWFHPCEMLCQNRVTLILLILQPWVFGLKLPCINHRASGCLSVKWVKIPPLKCLAAKALWIWGIRKFIMRSLRGGPQPGHEIPLRFIHIFGTEPKDHFTRYL